MGEELFPAFAEDACGVSAASGAVAVAELHVGALPAFFRQRSGLGGGESSVCPGLQHFLPCVGEDIAERNQFNTAIAAMMSLTNDIYDAGTLTVDELKTFITLLSPFAPHVTEEMWHELGESTFLSVEKWPEYDEAKTVESTIEIAVQVNGKLKGSMTMPTDSEEAAVVEAALAVEKVAKSVEGMKIVKTILVKNKLVNLIVK